MSSGLITRKVGMSRVFLASGEAVPVTFLKVDDNVVVRTKTKEKDGYQAVVLGVDQHVVRTRKGHELKKWKQQKEFRVDSLDGLAIGTTVTVTAVPADALVTLTGTSKGKGFQGVMKRHHFSGGPASHGSHFKREPGSVGMRTWPGRIHAGKKMPGHMGYVTVTIKHRPVIVNDTEKKVLAIKGAVPGPNGAIIYLVVEPPVVKKAAPQTKPAPATKK